MIAVPAIMVLPTIVVASPATVRPGGLSAVWQDAGRRLFLAGLLGRLALRDGFAAARVFGRGRGPRQQEGKRCSGQHLFQHDGSSAMCVGPVSAREAESPLNRPRG
jgi:hypothetical protein